MYQTKQELIEYANNGYLEKVSRTPQKLKNGFLGANNVYTFIYCHFIQHVRVRPLGVLGPPGAKGEDTLTQRHLLKSLK